jgi:zinc protease
MTFDVELERRLAAVTPDQVRAAMAKHISPGDLVVVKAGDFRKIVQ